jgi:hypothetical protein
MSVFKQLIALIVASALAQAQSAQVPAGLNISVVEGEGAFNNIKSRLGRNVRIAVKDQNGEPVSGAKVVFVAPAVGPGVTFAGGGNKYETVTDARGIASTEGLTPNVTEGSFGVRVSVTSGALSQTRLIRQSNTTAGGITDPHKSGRGKKGLLFGILAGGAAAGLAFGLRGGGGGGGTGTPGSGPTSVSIGDINVGGPR